MKLPATWSEQIRCDRPLPLVVDILLRAASLGQRLGMWMRLRGKRVRVPAHVVSFGNITVGGVGKTPAVIERARVETASGRQVAVITRGYGAAKVQLPITHEPGAPTQGMARIFGDEAAMIARACPETWIIRTANRVAGAREAVKRGCQVIILDDAFQAVTLDRDENIVLIDATNPFGNGHILPRGMLREPLSALRRATEIHITRCDQAPESTYTIKAAVQRHAPHAAVHLKIHRPTHFRKESNGENLPLTSLQGKRVRAVCGIGNPGAFFSTLESIGAIVTERLSYPDHASIPMTALEGPNAIVITEKDAARLETALPERVLTLCIAMEEYRPNHPG